MTTPHHFNYQVGICLEPTCDFPSVTGDLFCYMHVVSEPVKTERPLKGQSHQKQSVNTKTKDTKVSDMLENQIGYIEEYAFFEDKQKLHIIGSAFVSATSDRYKVVRIRYRKGIYEISRNSIDTNEIAYGWPDIANNVTCYTARIVNTF